MESMQQSGGSSRRQHKRVRLQAQVDIDVKGWAGGEAQCLDVSNGGIRLRLKDRVSVGDRLVFGASLPGQTDFKLQAEVRHVRKTQEGQYDVGLCWLAPDARGAMVFSALTTKSESNAA